MANGLATPAASASAPDPRSGALGTSAVAEQAADDPVPRDERPRPGPGVVGRFPVVAEQQVVPGGYVEPAAVHRSGRVRLVERLPVDGDDAVVERDVLAGEPDDPLDHPHRLTRVASAPPVVTAASFAPDGRRVVLVDYARAYFYRELGGPRPAVRGKPSLAQGESVEFSRDGTVAFVGSEGDRSPVYRMSAP